MESQTSASPRRYSLRQLAHSSLIYSISDLALKMIGLLLVPLYTRAMSPEEYGIVGYTMAIGQILAPMLGLGLVSSLPMLYCAYDVEQRKRLIGSTVNGVFIYSLVMALLLSLAGKDLFGHVASTVPFSPYMELIIWSTFFTGLYYLPLGIFNMSERPIPYLAYSLSLALVNVTLALVLVVVFKLGALGMLWAGFVTGVVGMVVTVIAIRGNYRCVFDWDKIKALLLLALPILPHLFSGTILRLADRLFLANWSTLSNTGIYSFAMVVVSPILILMGGIFTALNPMFYRRAAEQDPALKADWGRLSTLYVMAGSIIALGVAVFARELVEILAPGGYHAAQHVVPLLALAQLFTGLYWLGSPGIGHSRKTWVYLVASFIAVATNLVLNFLLIPSYGLIGAAWATIVSAIVQFYVFWRFSQHFFPICYEYSQIAKIALFCILAFALSQTVVMQPLWLSFLWKSMIMAVLCLSFIRFGVLSKSEVDSAKNYIKSYFGRVSAI